MKRTVGMRRREVIVISSGSSGSFSDSYASEPLIPSRISESLSGSYGSEPLLGLFAERINWGPNQWVYVHTESGHVYMVNMDRKTNYHELNIGWDLVVTCEGLQADQAVSLEYHDNYPVLRLDEESDVQHAAGFANGVEMHGGALFRVRDVHTAEGVKVNGRIVRGLSAMWVAAGGRSSMYVCIINDSQKKDGSMFFSKKYSKVIPAKKETVALRFIGSPVIICCSIHGYKSGTSRITQGWKLFVEEHSIVEGDVLVFCCYRGPAMWEMLVSRV